MKKKGGEKMKIGALLEKLRRLIAGRKRRRQRQAEKIDFVDFSTGPDEFVAEDPKQIMAEREGKKRSDPGYRLRSEQWEKRIDSHGDL